MHVLELGLAATNGDNVFTVLLAALNVVQTIALAYLAASRHVDTHSRRRPSASRRPGGGAL